MKEFKVMTILGTRPDIIKLSRVMAELDKTVNHVLVHTGQNYDYELNQVFFDDLNVKKPDYFLSVSAKTAAETISNVIKFSDEVIEKENPDAVLIYGDTNSSLAVISAKRRQVPIFHMEAGNRCFDQRVPEEINRKIVDHLSDINMPLTEHARQYLIQEGIPANRIIKTGSCMKEVINGNFPKIKNSKILIDLNLKKEGYFLVSAHREENVDYFKNINKLLGSLNAIAEKYKKRIIFSTHPRTKNRIDSLKNKIEVNELIEFVKPFGFCDYMKLQINSICVISDSGTITEESSILGFPAITIRNAHERPEGMDEGTLIMSGLEENIILKSIEVLLAQSKERKPYLVKDYDLDNVSLKVIRIILSYTNYVNNFIWKKSEDNKFI
jgi:UDP-N-acetylglucosamine 2-epimerase